MNKVRCDIEYETGNFIIIDDNEKMITEISKDVIELFYSLKYIINKKVDISCNDAINFYNEFISTAINNKNETNKKDHYSKSHIFINDIS
jgi:hypothetical protein